MPRLLVLLLGLSLAACATDSADAPATPASADPTASDASTAEPFAEFFERFRADTTFQRERVADDFTQRFFDTEGLEPELVEQRGGFVPAALDWAGGESVRTTFTTEYSDAGVTEDAASVDPAAVSVDYQISGTDNGVSVSYRFVRGDDGLWRLVEIEDGSM